MSSGDSESDSFLPYHFLRTSGTEPPSSHVEAQIAFYAMDSSTPIYEDTCSALSADLAVVTSAAEALQTGRQYAYALTAQPGHHAAPCHGGYCLINYAAVAAHRLQNGGARVGH